MNELIDKFLLELFEGINDKLTVLMGEFITDSQALAAAFMLMYFGLESFKMMSGDKKLEIIPLLRPFAFGLILMLWNPFIETISYPGEVLTATSKSMFENQIDEVEMLSRNRYALIDSVSMELLATSVEVERAENETNKDKWSIRHYKIFCVNGNTGFRNESRIFYFIHLQNEEAYERKESSSA